jgi:glycosyltransferase involved in cell wall biosynthesis
MRIGVDTHAISSPGTGNRTYFLGLTQGLAEIDQSNDYILYAKTSDQAYAPFQGIPNIRVKPVSSSAGGRLLCSLPAAAFHDPVDVLHVQYLAPILWRSALVATIYDICYEHFPQFYSWQTLRIARPWTYWTARRADCVITISEYSRRDIARVTGIPLDKIVSIPIAANRRFYLPKDARSLEAIRWKYDLPKDYILFVGRTDDPRKNLAALIHAYALLRQSDEIQHCLILAGRHGPHTGELIELARSSGLTTQVRFPGVIADEDLPALITAADAFVYPSLFEGFGLPVLEAMACGTPVVTSNRASLPEVVGEAALVVDPDDTEELAHALVRLVSDRTLHDHLAQVGMARAQIFSWPETARRTLEVYESVYERFAGRQKGHVQR